MRKLTWGLTGLMAITTFAPIPVMAQPGPDRYASEACVRAITREVQDRYPQAGRVNVLTREPVPISDRETRVTGKGEFDDRNGGVARFGYGCSFNSRSGATYALDVNNVRPGGDGKKDNSAAIAGLVLGAIVIGAIAANSKDKDRDRDRDRNDFSPADGVRCSPRRAECYKDGRYSEKWTRRIFVR